MLPDTFIFAKPVDLRSDQFPPAVPFARLKLSSTGVVGAGAGMVLVGLLAAWFVPAVLVAVTSTSIVKPMSWLVMV